MRKGVEAALALAVVTLAACAGVDKLHEQYPGHKVIDKNVETTMRRVQIRQVVYFLPDGRILCAIDYPPGDICWKASELQSRKVPVMKREFWTDRYVNEPDHTYVLTLVRPDGGEMRQEVSESQFNGTLVGQTLGKKNR